MKYIITAIICTLILSISLYSIQVNKQASIERQKQMEIDQKQAELDFERELKEEEKNKEAQNKNLLNICLNEAKRKGFQFAELNGIKNDDGSVRASNAIWREADAIEAKETDLCFKKYN